MHVTRSVAVNIPLRVLILFNVTLYVCVYTTSGITMERCDYLCDNILCKMFRREKFHPENFRKSGKLPVGEISPGEFQEIRETSRRGNFHRCFI